MYEQYMNVCEQPTKTSLWCSARSIFTLHAFAFDTLMAI